MHLESDLPTSTSPGNVVHNTPPPQQPIGRGIRALLGLDSEDSRLIFVEQTNLRLASHYQV